MLKSLDPPTEVWFERENLRSLDDKSNVLISLLSALSQEESVNIGEAIAWGKRSLAQRGIVTPGNIGYGFQYGKNKEWLINEEEAEVVRLIYNEYEAEKRISRVKDLLTSKNIPTPERKKRWHETTIKRILTSEIYRGNYIYQRYHTGFTLAQERVKNTGELPMYFIDNHHEGIIDSAQWNRVQNIIEESEKIRKENIQEYPEDEGKNKAFNKKLYCSKCGSVVGYVRAIRRQRKSYEMRWWRCHQALKGYCDVPYMRQEYIEENFSQLLLDIKFNPAFNDYIRSFMENLKIKPEEEKQRDELKEEKEKLNMRLYQAVENELGKSGKDAKLVDYLTDEIMKIRAELSNYTEREEQLEAIESEIINLRKSLEGLKDKRKDPLGYYQDTLEFQSELFEQFIDKGFVLEDGQITYQFISGFEWGVPINYGSFQEQKRLKRAAKRAAEKEAFLNGTEVRGLLKFCREPKSLTEMREYLPKYAQNDTFKRNIVIPLMEKGILKQTLPDQPSSRLQKYYSVKK